MLFISTPSSFFRYKYSYINTQYKKENLIKKGFDNKNFEWIIKSEMYKSGRVDSENRGLTPSRAYIASILARAAFPLLCLAFSFFCVCILYKNLYQYEEFLVCILRIGKGDKQ